MKSRNTIAGVAVLGTLAVALVLGTQYLNNDSESTTVVTVLGLLGLAISQLLGNQEAAEANQKTDELSKDLHNGTFEKLLREALQKLANENGVPLEIQNHHTESGKEENGNG